MGSSALCGSKQTAAVAPLSTRVAPVGASSSTVNTVTTSSSVDKKEAPSPNKRMRLQIGSEVLKSYEPKALIGKGSFSKVLVVESRESGERFALKVVNRKHIAEYNIETELRILKQIDHPYIVHLYETIISDQHIYMIMELAEGGDVHNKVNTNGPLDEEEARRIVKMVVEGVHYLHQCGITHRDLKLENLLYKHNSEGSDILISDFGLAYQISDHNDIMMTTCGTSEYLAPEMIEGDTYCNAVDMWTIGVITFILLSGQMPFEEGKKTKLYQMILKGEYSFQAELSSRLHYKVAMCGPY
ncbi:serine/threonine-protein kinase H1-like isoform X2 [Dysidea avara]|uniref:serine/threonine-protein kinase H1-like isoform X2 n=1 Tax=Dysidea avara TaxID=196820 RepID=UPI00332903BC